jgi:hypothetical protein
MSLNAISAFTPPSALSASKSRADETAQQLAQQGDPIAIAKLKQEQGEEDQTTSTVASEPGKGEQLDRYL